jgi:hypothetical protein
MYALAILAHKIGMPELANSIPTFTYYGSKTASFHKSSQKKLMTIYARRFAGLTTVLLKRSVWPCLER